jgi:hypothetical protein
MLKRILGAYVAASLAATVVSAADLDSIFNVGGQLDDTATTLPSENDFTHWRMTPQRGGHVNLRNQAGTEVGTSTNRLFVESLPTDNVISATNSTTSTLLSGATFTGTFVDLLGYADVIVSGKASHASAVGGLIIEFSTDGTNVDDSDSYTIAAATGFQYSFSTSTRYARVRYTNGGTGQSYFRLQTILKRTQGKPSSHRIESPITGENDAELVKSVVTGKDPNGVYRNLQVDEDGNLIITALTGFGAAFTFGDITTAAVTQVAVRRTAYNEQTTNAQRSFSSSDVDDDAVPAGTGARTLKLTYLDQTGAGPFTETISMNGTTCVASVATNIAFVDSVKVVTVGGTASNEGTVSMFVNAACGGGTIGTIAINNNQTFWAHHYVPINEIANVTGISGSHNGTTVGSGATFILKAKNLSVVGAVEEQVSDFVRLYGQSSTFARTYTSPIKISGPARVILYVTPETSSSTVYRGSFDFFQP